jgi:hypothetical protein
MGVAIISLLIFSYLNLSSYTITKTTFSLSQKMALAESIASTAKTADIATPMVGTLGCLIYLSNRVSK